ncbi:MAG: DUF4830 domain-containing protein [Oscillospiraceae bacterium]|nr:DUF4830 domain-containing protein [Oscillospiraceae bacterium]
MFVVTLNKPVLKKIAVVTCCALVLVAGVAIVGGVIKGKTEAVNVAANTSVKNTDDMVNYLLGYGVDTDVGTAEVSNVKVPKKFDADFEAFNEVIKKSGGDLNKYKGKTVEKWLILSPGRSTADQQAYAVLLIYKEKIVGSYIITKPAGEVLALSETVGENKADGNAQNTMTDAEVAQETAETAAAAEAGAAGATGDAAAVEDIVEQSKQTAAEIDQLVDGVTAGTKVEGEATQTAAEADFPTE